MSQQTLELLMFESIYEGKIKELIKTLQDINDFFNNENMSFIINELQKY